LIKIGHRQHSRLIGLEYTNLDDGRHHLVKVTKFQTETLPGAHSLRAGFLTSAARSGASVFKMRDVSRHKSMDVLQAYVRDADLFRDHAGAGLL
jgi:hypothetical protein